MEGIRLGFTLIEVMIVCSLVLLCVGIGVIHMSYIRNLLVRSELDKLHAACMYMQASAQVNNIPKTITFDLAQRSYRCDKECSMQLPTQVRFASTLITRGSCKRAAIPRAVTFKNDRITFYPTGIIQAGTVYFSDTRSEYVYALSSAVAQVSFLRKYRYEGSWQYLA